MKRVFTDDSLFSFVDRIITFVNGKLSTFFDEHPVNVEAILDDDGVLYFSANEIENADEVSY